MKTIHIHSLSLLNFVYLIVVFVVEKSLENAKLAILERQGLQIIFVISQPRWGDGDANFPREKFPLF